MSHGFAAKHRASQRGPTGALGAFPTPTGIKALWVADDCAGVGDGNPVSSWTDRIGGVTVSQGTGSAQPTYRSAGLGGQPSVQFDGGDVLSFAGADPVSISSSGSVIAVGSADAGKAFWSSARNTGDQHYMMGVVDGSQLRMQSRSAGGGADIFYATPPTGANIYEWSSFAGAWTIRLGDQTKPLTASAGTNDGRWFSGVTSRDRFALGGLVYNGTQNNFLTGHIAAMIVVDGEMSSSDRSALYAWLFARYGISIEPPPPYFTGGTVTETATHRIHTFTGSGTLTCVTPGVVEYLVVGGGGGGGCWAGGGGGGGGLLSGSTALTANATITVGAGGAAATTNYQNGGAGGTSSIDTIVAKGGSGGRGDGASAPADGGCGGGGSAANSSPYTGNSGFNGTAGQGYAGGSGVTGATAGGGGGGAGSAGTDAADGVGGTGGSGVASSISGTSVVYSGGGGGAYQGGGGSGSGGGAGGNGGRSGVSDATAGATNRGGGGGGGYTAVNAVAAAGGSGIVIIRYPIR